MGNVYSSPLTGACRACTPRRGAGAAVLWGKAPPCNDGGSTSVRGCTRGSECVAHVAFAVSAFDPINSGVCTTQSTLGNSRTPRGHFHSTALAPSGRRCSVVSARGRERSAGGRQSSVQWSSVCGCKNVESTSCWTEQRRRISLISRIDRGHTHCHPGDGRKSFSYVIFNGVIDYVTESLSW